MIIRENRKDWVDLHTKRFIFSLKKKNHDDSFIKHESFFFVSVNLSLYVTLFKITPLFYFKMEMKDVGQ